MPGISQVLNIAKEALLAHQMAIGVTGHNVANVNTEGFSRQSIDLQATLASPSGVGYFGNGVRGENVHRNYDRFMVQRLVSQESTLNDLQAQNESMRVVETAFNEAPGMAVNDLLSQFWSSWQDLSDNPELISSRQTVVQQAKLINEQLHNMTAEIARSRQDIDSNLQSAVLDVNALTQQIADLNVEITSSESDLQKQNDLRDKRDLLTKELGQYFDINYFEMDSGSYTILLKDGHSLVENNEAWSVNWLDNKLKWVSTNATGSQTSTTIGHGENLGGKIGGWMEVHSQLIEGQPENYLGRLNALGNSLIREVNQLHTQGVGLERFTSQFTSQEVAATTTLLHSTVDTTTALEEIPAGSLTINDREVGRISGAVAVEGLAMGKTANAAAAINDSLSDVKARMTTLVAGPAVGSMIAGEVGSATSFAINGVTVNYTVQAADVGAPATLAANLVSAINTALATHNNATGPENIPKITISAAVGDGTNGGILNSIVLQNTDQGDESRIIISDIETDTTAAIYPTEQKLGLTNGTYVADATHNTGELSLFNHNGAIVIDGGPDDTYLTYLGLGGGSFGVNDVSGDGKIDFRSSDHSVTASMMGYDYSDELITDGGSFKIWLYNSDNTLALPQPVDIPLERAYTLNDVANAINISIENASGVSPSWLDATVVNGQLVMTPDATHSFAFGGDNSNFMATAGINTFFTGYDASTIDVNPLLQNNLQHLAAGQVDSHGDIFSGDESNALLITNIQRLEDIRFTGAENNTLDGHYNSLVSAVGLKSRSVERDFDYNTLVTTQMNEMRDATSGVNLDEEMANLIKFQHAYSAAAKLITTSDEMLQTLLSSVGR